MDSDDKEVGCCPVSPYAIGILVDEITGNSEREPKYVFLRAIAEMVELGLKLGVSPAEIRGALEDQVSAECLKQSEVQGSTVFPSQLCSSLSVTGATEELGDVFLVLKDLIFTLDLSESVVEYAAYQKYLKLFQTPIDGFRKNRHTFYLKKSHVIDTED